MTVDDGADETAATFSVVAEVNHDPVADAGGPYVVNEGSLFSLDASATTDVDGNALTFAWTLDGKALGSPLWITGRCGRVWQTTAAMAPTVEVRDGRGGSDTDASAVTVLNVAPSVDATASRTLTLHGPPPSPPRTRHLH